MFGGAGNDKLWGGTEADVFVYSNAFGADIITDFSVSEDKLDLQSLGIGSTVELLPYARNNGASFVLNFGTGNMITIWNAQVAKVHDGMLGKIGAVLPGHARDQCDLVLQGWELLCTRDTDAA